VACRGDPPNRTEPVAGGSAVGSRSLAGRREAGRRPVEHRLERWLEAIFLALYLFGVATAGLDRRARLRLALGLVALFALSLGVRIPLTDSVFGLALLLYLLLTALGLVLAVPLFGLGRAVAGHDRRRPG